MSGKWESISFADLIVERKDRFEPDAPEIRGLPKIDKIDFAEGRLHLGEYEPTKTQQIIVEPGDFVFSGLNIEKGAAGFNETGGRLVVSANYSTCSYNDSRVSLDFFKHYMRSENFQRLLKANLKKDYGFTRPKHLMPLTFLVPRDKKEQGRIVNDYEQCKATHSRLSDEITHQQSLLAKLKQAILQEAIQGKLTADWRAAHPDVEPASQLLHRIQAEKARLIAAKKLRPEKPLPKITPAEIPVEIPKGWEWCRLGNLIGDTDSGWSPACLKNEAPVGKWGVLRTTAVQVSEYLEHENKELPPTLTPRPEAEARPGDILMTRAGPANRVGICCLVRATRPLLMISDKLVRFRPVLADPEYIELFAATPQFQKLIEASKQGMAQSQVNISRENLTATLVPLPPLTEQAEIVERVEALMTTCRALEAEIEHARAHAAHLLQAVLKEAFAPAR